MKIEITKYELITAFPANSPKTLLRLISNKTGVPTNRLVVHSMQELQDKPSYLVEYDIAKEEM